MTFRERLGRFFLRGDVIRFNFGPSAPTQVLNYTATQLYQSQDNLQAVVNYLSNSIAQLPLKVYTRDDEAQRHRDRTSTAAKLLWQPNRWQTSYEFNRALVSEYFVYGAVYTWLAPSNETESGWELFIIPTTWLADRPETSSNPYEPDTVWVQIPDGRGTAFELPASEFVLFRTYSPGNPGGYLSPLTALKQTLQEQIEAGNFRRELWRSSGRLNAQITRPANVQPWDDETRKRFVDAFRAAWGSGGSKAGSIPLLEDGMEIKPFQTSFKESQWAESVKLSRETVAAAYGVNPALIWHTDAQTYASSKDNARALYSECLGPVLQMLQQRINTFILPKVGADPTTYVEFDLSEKLKGSFEERASILQSAVGGPWMTRNEARADNNLPPLVGGDDLIVPLNVTEGGQASPQDTHMDPQEPMTTEPTEIAEDSAPAPAGHKCDCPEHKNIPEEQKAQIIELKSKSMEDEDDAITEAVLNFLIRQSRSVLAKIRAGAENWWSTERWNRELADDIEALLFDISKNHGKGAAKKLGVDYSDEETVNYIRAMAEGRADAINRKTLAKLTQEMETAEREQTEPDFEKVFEDRQSRADAIGRSLATAAATFGVMEAVGQAHDSGNFPVISKIWNTGDNPRPSHAAMDGETVPYDGNFSNGAYWPGDDNLSADESCGCNCSVTIQAEVI